MRDREKKSPDVIGRRHELHIEKVRRIREAIQMAKDVKHPRHRERMQRKRELERDLRIDVMAHCRWTRRCGMKLSEAAGNLGIRPDLVVEWERRWQVNRLQPKPRGRKFEDLDWPTRVMLMGIFNLMGPGIGLESLSAVLPSNTQRNALERYLERYKRIHIRKNRVVVHVLRWHIPGTVWAIDFADAPQPIDGLYPYVLLVRDLASGDVLMALPVSDKEQAGVVQALESLFKQHGTPLVLKADWGFAGKGIADLLEKNQVAHLLSPPRLPSYNGAIEAGVGSIKTRAHHEAARHGHPGEWNCEDVEAARLQANETAHPWGAAAPTPDIAWIERQGITEVQRAAFLKTIEDLRPKVQEELQYLPGIPLGPKDQAAVDRVAIGRALVAHGLLSFRRSRITLPIKALSCRKVS